MNVWDSLRRYGNHETIKRINGKNSGYTDSIVSAGIQHRIKKRRKWNNKLTPNQYQKRIAKYGQYKNTSHTDSYTDWLMA
jgi:hypothetical protein